MARHGSSKAAKKAARTSKAAKKTAKTRARHRGGIHRGVLGGWYNALGHRVARPRRSKAKKKPHRSKGRKTGRRLPKCPHCSFRPIGGEKGMQSHLRHAHGGRRRRG